MVDIEQIDKIRTHEDLSRFILELREDFATNKQNWENQDIASYLNAMAAWVEDAPGYFSNANRAMPQDNCWKLIATVLIAAKMYE